MKISSMYLELRHSAGRIKSSWRS